MWPQKWNASARSLPSAAPATPPATSSLPRRARNPRRDVASTTASLSRSRTRTRDQRVELRERVERPLREHGSARVHHDAERASGNVQRTPHVGVAPLVEDLDGDTRRARDETHRRLERLTQAARRRREDRDRE